MRMSDAMDRLRGELRYEPTGKRVRAELGGHLVVDTTRAALVWEPRRITPTYAVPAEDLWGELSPADGTEPAPDGILHPGIPFAAHSTPGEPLTVTAHGETRQGAAFRPAATDLAGHVVLDFDAFDRWYQEDEPLRGHPRDPYHRVDAHLSSRHVRIVYKGRTLADTTRATLVYETSLPTRFYIPRADITVPLKESGTRTYCPYKGEASYFSIDGHDDIAWSYENPLPDAPPLGELIAFFDDIMDVTVDGVQRERPDTPVSRLMLEEFGVS
jgi:uncharacterized protein (DUF427 family)